MKDMIIKKVNAPELICNIGGCITKKMNLLSPEKYASFIDSEQDEILAKIYTYQKKLADNNDGF